MVGDREQQFRHVENGVTVPQEFDLERSEVPPRLGGGGTPQMGMQAKPWVEISDGSVYPAFWKLPMMPDCFLKTG